MGHLTLKMLSIIASSLMIFGLAKADAMETKQADNRDPDKLDTENEKEKRSEERFRAEQSIKRALRDQERARNSVPITPLPPKKTD